MCVLELGIDVPLPVELVDEVVEVVVLVLGDVLDEQAPGHAPAFDHRLVHAEDVGAPLRLVGHERAGGVQDAWGDQPAGAGLEAVGLREVEDAVVPLVPTLQAAADVVLGRPGLQAEEGVGEVVAGPVELGGEVVALGLPSRPSLAACSAFWCM